MNDFRYILDPGSRKFICPGCEKRRLVRYIDQTTGQYLPEKYGRCDREINCAYHQNPYDDRYGKDEPYKPIPTPKPKPISYFDINILKQSRSRYDQNNFVIWLTSIFSNEIVSDLISRYHIGTSKHWPGSTIFWQIDHNGKIRSGKIMLYDADSGKRVKEPYNHITWAHRAMKLKDFNLKQCYFGEHLLKLNPFKPVALVESEKTAIISSVYFPSFVWLAVGSLTNLNQDKCKPLQGRRVVLFPDLNGYERWSQKADELQKAYPGTTFLASSFLEDNAPDDDREKGYDLADYLIRFKIEDFQKKPVAEVAVLADWKKRPQGKWKLDDLESFFSETEIPETITVNPYTKILDSKKFIKNQLAECRAHDGNVYFQSGYESLLELKQMFNKN